MNSATNTKDFDLPAFSQLHPEDIEPAIDQILEDNRKTLKSLLADNVQ
jgi:oligopeptidase A